MLVLGDLRPVFGALDACPAGTILACREATTPAWTTRSGALHGLRRSDADLHRLGVTARRRRYPLVVNDGIFAGRARRCWRSTAIRAMPLATRWVDERHDIWWRNQFVFNLALAHLRCGVELDPSYNVQLHVQDVELRQDHVRLAAGWHGRPARVLHFSGAGEIEVPGVAGPLRTRRRAARRPRGRATATRRFSTRCAPGSASTARRARLVVLRAHRRTRARG